MGVRSPPAVTTLAVKVLRLEGQGWIRRKYATIETINSSIKIAIVVGEKRLELSWYRQKTNRAPNAAINFIVA